MMLLSWNAYTILRLKIPVNIQVETTKIVQKYFPENCINLSNLMIKKSSLFIAKIINVKDIIFFL